MTLLPDTGAPLKPNEIRITFHIKRRGILCLLLADVYYRAHLPGRHAVVHWLCVRMGRYIVFD